MSIEAKIHSLTNKRNSIIIAILSCAIAAAAIGFFIINATTPKTYLLGDPGKLEYIGKTSYGCWIVCDANPTEVYYYATNMRPEEVASYFKKAKLHRPIEDNLDSISISLDHGDSDFVFSYYDKPADSLKKHLAPTEKHIVSIANFDYQVAKDSL